MKKNINIILILGLFLVMLTGCTKMQNNKKALEFKEEYEALNKSDDSSIEYRIVNIPEDNPYYKISPEQVLKKIENKETFYLYVGDSLCPWCRSVIEKSIEVAKKNNIEKIYYIDIWDEEGNEIFRDKYVLQNNNPVKIVEGTKEYNKLLDYFDKLLDDYTLTDSNGEEMSMGEKRIYAPNYFYVENGIAIKMVEGISENQESSIDELTQEILQDEEKIFEEFFSNTCDSYVC